MDDVDDVPVGAIVTVFRSRLAASADEAGYEEWASRTEELARAMPGFVEFKTFTADDGERVSLVAFADWGAHDAWARHPVHREAQQRGRAVFYDEFRITVGEVSRRHAFVRDSLFKA